VNDFIALIILYSIASLVYITVFISNILKDRKLNAIVIVRFMYLLIYGIVPIVTFSHVMNYGIDYHTRTLQISQEGMDHLLIFMPLTFIGYIFLEMGYKRRYTIKINRSIERTDKQYSERALWKAALLMTVISVVALFMWTYPFGGPIAMFEYGTLIRSGREIAGITNSFGFMKQFVPLAHFSSIISLALWKKEKRFYYGILFIIGLIISIVYLISNDGRAPFMMYLASLLILLYLMRKSNANRIKIIPIIIIAAIGIVFLENVDNITSYVRSGVIETTSETKGFFTFLYSEFSWVVRNGQTVQEAAAKGESTLRIGRDLLSAIFAILPSRFSPVWIKRLEFTNTEMWLNGIVGYGGKPTDIITTGMYELSFLGALVLPYVYGAIVKGFDNRFKNMDGSLYSKILFVQLVYQFAKTVAYADFALVTLNLFYLIVGHIIVCFFNRGYRPSVTTQEIRTEGIR